MTGTQHKRLRTALAGLLAVMATLALLPGGAAADINQTNTVDDFEALEYEVVSSGSTTVDVTITDSNGNTVQTDTINTASDTITKTYNLDPGDYTISTTAGDTTVIDSETVSVVSTTTQFSSDDVELGTDEKIVTDVEFSANTSALVEVQNDTGSVVASERIDAESSDYTNNEWYTAEFTDLDSGNYTVTVDAEDTSAINQTEVTTASTGLFGGGGVIGGASMTQLGAFVLVVSGVAYAYREDYL